MKTNSKGQTWSMDLVVGSVIFLFVLAMFYTILIVGQDDQELVRQESERLVAAFDSDVNPEPSMRQFMTGSNINREDLIDLYVNEEYDAIKNQLGLTGDFCILLTMDTGGGEEIILSLSNTGTGNHSFGNAEDLYIDREQTMVCGDNTV